MSNEPDEFLERLDKLRRRISNLTHIDAKQLFVQELAPLLRMQHKLYKDTFAEVDAMFEDMQNDVDDTNIDAEFLDDTYDVLGEFTAFIDAVCVKAGYLVRVDGGYSNDNMPPQLRDQYAKISSRYVNWQEQFAEIRAIADEYSDEEEEEGEGEGEGEGEDTLTALPVQPPTVSPPVVSPPAVNPPEVLPPSTADADVPEEYNDG